MSGRLPALREPAFRNLFAGQALSRLGDRIAPIALAFGVIGSGGSAADLATKLMRLIDALADNDDVDAVHANFDAPAEVLEQLAAAG